MKRTANQDEVNQVVESLIRGGKARDVPPHLIKDVLFQLMNTRKDAMLHRNDQVVNRIDEVSGELQRGPNAFVYDEPGDPVLKRTMTRSLPSLKDDKLKTTSKLLASGAKPETIDTMSLATVNDVLKESRLKQSSKTHYGKSSTYNRTIESVNEYNADSRRLGPRLLQIQELERKVAEARKKLEDIKTNNQQKRLLFDEQKKMAEAELEAQLKGEIVELGSHVPTTLPLEYSKLSNKVLNTRQKEYYAANIYRYDDATNYHSEAHRKEREELDTLNERFVRSFKLNRRNLLSKQGQKRQCFTEVWERKRTKMNTEMQHEVEKAKKALDRLECELGQCRNGVRGEYSRIKSNERAQTSIGHRF